jgi:hypothetical protein
MYNLAKVVNAYPVGEHNEYDSDMLIGQPPLSITPVHSNSPSKRPVILSCVQKILTEEEPNCGIDPPPFKFVPPLPAAFGPGYAGRDYARLRLDVPAQKLCGKKLDGVCVSLREPLRIDKYDPV